MSTIRTLLINDIYIASDLKQKLNAFCPQLKIIAQTTDVLKAKRFVEAKQPDLIFFELPTSFSENKLATFLELDILHAEVICVLEQQNYLLEDIKNAGFRYLHHPIDIEKLICCTYDAQESIEQKAKQQHNQKMLQKLINLSSHKSRVGIPTMKGLEFVTVDEIVRCEGLQKCTKVILLDGSKVVSSYNIGEFHNLLGNYGFFATHKSHLVNLLHIQRYEKEGIITMTDSSFVPVSRRKRTEFLEKLTRL